MAQEKDNATAFDEALFGWIAPEYLRYERGWLWFALLITVSAGLVAYAYRTDSVTMMVLFAILPLVLILEHRRKPKAVEVIFSHYGVKFGVLRLPYSSLRSFAVLHHPPHTDELHLMTNRKAHPEVVIPLMGTNPALLRQYLVTQLPEQEGKQLTFLDLIVRVLRLN